MFPIPKTWLKNTVRIKNRNRERPHLPFSFKNVTFIWFPQTSSYASFIQKHHLHLASTNILVCLFHSKTSPSFGFHKRVRVCLFIQKHHLHLVSTNKSTFILILFTVDHFTPFWKNYEPVHQFALDARRHPLCDYFGSRAALHFFISSCEGGCIQIIIAVHRYDGARFCCYVPLMEDAPFVFIVIRFRHRINH